MNNAEMQATEKARTPWDWAALVATWVAVLGALSGAILGRIGILPPGLEVPAAVLAVLGAMTVWGRIAISFLLTPHKGESWTAVALALASVLVATAPRTLPDGGQQTLTPDDSKATQMLRYIDALDVQLDVTPASPEVPLSGYLEPAGMKAGGILEVNPEPDESPRVLPPMTGFAVPLPWLRRKAREGARRRGIRGPIQAMSLVLLLVFCSSCAVISPAVRADTETVTAALVRYYSMDPNLDDSRRATRIETVNKHLEVTRDGWLTGPFRAGTTLLTCRLTQYLERDAGLDPSVRTALEAKAKGLRVSVGGPEVCPEVGR